MPICHGMTAMSQSGLCAAKVFCHVDEAQQQTPLLLSTAGLTQDGAPATDAAVIARRASDH